MSFSSETKKELSKIKNTNRCCDFSECYGMLTFAKKFSNSQIILTTENPYVANRFCELIAGMLCVTTEKHITLTAKKGGTHLYTVFIPNSDECNKVFTYFGHHNGDISLRINRGNFEDDNCVSSFLRGAFLSCGTVTDPKGDYHLEFTAPYKNLCSGLCKLISEIEELNSNFKVVNRKGYFVAYIKGSDKISDILTYIGAPIAAMSIMQEKIVKELRNSINRKTNSEVANIKKTVNASTNQIEAIKKIQKYKGLFSLSDDLRILAEIRLENPDFSLSDIGQLLKPPISRSGVNHRIKRIMEIANSIEG